jgi:carbon monoxide dehydrogenase subunit G
MHFENGGLIRPDGGFKIMNHFSNFESRTGRPLATQEEVFAFMTDLRNFSQFVPANSVDSIKLDKESCSFVITGIGSVDIRLVRKIPFDTVEYAGNALQDNEFSMTININNKDSGATEVKISLNAQLNPFLRIMASGPITGFLETLIDEMENFHGWGKTNP